MTETNFPIQRIRKLSQVDRGLTDQRTVRAIRSTRSIELGGYLSNATALAAAIAELAPDLAQRVPLKVVVVTFEAADAIDECRWFQIAAPLLSRTDPFELECVVTGPRLQGDDMPSSVGHLMTHLPGARIHRRPVGEYFANTGMPDVVFFCHPNLLEEPAHLHELEWVQTVLEEEVPVLGWSFSALERDLFCSTLEANGWGRRQVFDAKVYGVSEVPGWHPLENGRYLWCLSSRGNENPPDVSEWGVRELTRLAARHGNALDSGRAHPWCGKVRPLPGFPGGVAFSVDEHAVSLADGKRLEATARPGASVPTVRVVGEAERWEPVSLEDGQCLSPLDVASLVDLAGAKYLFPKGFSVDEAMDERFIDMLTQDADPELADGMRQMVAMMKAKTGVETGDPLFVAAEADDAEAIHALVAEGDVPNRRDASGRTPLIIAASVNATRSVKALLDCGAEVDMVLGFNHMTPAQVALTHGAVAAMLILLQHGAEIDRVSAFGQNLLRDFLESGQGGASVQAWYRDGLASGRIPAAPVNDPDE